MTYVIFISCFTAIYSGNLQMSKQTATHFVCPECGSTNLIRDVEIGESICGSCGLVIQANLLDRGAEWRAFTPQEKATRARAGAPTRYSHYDKGLSTTIRVDRDAFGRPLSPEVKRQMWRLRKWHLRSSYHASKDRNLSKAMNELQRLSEKLHIPPSVQEMAAVVYRKALNEDLVQGRSIAAMVAGSLYAACRFTKTPRTLKEIIDASPRDPKEVSRTYRLIVRNLEMTMPIDDPLDYVTKIAEKARVSSDVEGLAIKIIRTAKDNHATIGKDPSGLAAAALYIASKLKKEKTTQSHLAKAADVTEVTIRNRKHDLINSVNLNSI
jgi:transcription initiation factor TFIIB